MATTKKVTDLTALTTATGDDLLYIVNDPSGTPGSRKITVTNFFANVQTNTRISGTTLTVNAATTVSANVTLNGTIKSSGNINLLSSSLAQLQYNPNTNVSDSTSGNSTWVYAMADSVGAEVFSGETLKSGVYLNLTNTQFAVGSNVWTMHSNSALQFPDATQQTTAYKSIPNTTVTTGTVTVTSNGTSNVAFLTYQFANGKTGCAELTVHARDVTTDEITAGRITVAVQNSSSISIDQSVAQVGENSISFSITPVVNNSTNNVTMYVTRGASSTSNLTIRYSLTVF